MRDGRFALINPVITSTDGRCVARIRWMPTARAICASRAIDSSTSLLRDHHQVGELVDHHDDEGERLRRISILAARFLEHQLDVAAVLLDVADPFGVRASCSAPPSRAPPSGARWPPSSDPRPPA